MAKEPQKNQAAVELGKLRAAKMTTKERQAAGKARAASLSSAQRKKIARAAAKARWGNRKAKRVTGGLE